MTRARAWASRHAGALAVLLVGTIAVVAIVGVVHEGSNRRSSDRSAVAAEDIRQAREAEERRDQICASIDGNRQGLLDLVDAVLADDAPPRPPLTSTPEFAALDPPTQRFVVLAFSGSGSSLAARLEGFREGLLATPLPDFCPAEPSATTTTEETP